MGAAELANYYITPEEYFAAELLSPYRSEYVAGVVYPMAGTHTAMAGASHAHARITGNIFAALLNQLRGRRCEPFFTDTKVSIRKGEAQFYYYPDVVVDCGKASDDSYFAVEPRVIFEVLSKETARIDRDEKRGNYQSLPCLDAYVLVDQSRLAITVYRHEGGNWTTDLLTKVEETLDLPTIDCSLPLAVIYERTRLLG